MWHTISCKGDALAAEIQAEVDAILGADLAHVVPVRVGVEDGVVPYRASLGRHERVEVDGQVFTTAAMPPFIIDMMRLGGLVPYVRTRLAARAQNEK